MAQILAQRSDRLVAKIPIERNTTDDRLRLLVVVVPGETSRRICHTTRSPTTPPQDNGHRQGPRPATCLHPPHPKIRGKTTVAWQGSSPTTIIVDAAPSKIVAATSTPSTLGAPPPRPDAGGSDEMEAD
ncbi:hypothetical protein QYE76_057621 [Lolium multiflorum]|uniref:Uncharacterized protein n=1 Tax=Lolium multiflorum TaxID=4521 RepID=A0AAD8T3Q4_LOLMU|nr:hypothetical protein QYE76_057621 [Lolium multiflorum]